MVAKTQSPAVDVIALLNEHRVSRYQVLVAALCAAVVFMDGYDAQAIGYVAPTLSRLWQLKPGALGPVFGGGLFGLTIGALVAGPLADRLGRKPVILFSTFFFGVCTLLTVTADSLSSLLVWRFLTGLGLGGAMPNAIALTSEYSPDRSRATMVMVMFIGFSLGSALGGAIAAQLVPIYGWTTVFWLGGILPLLLLPVLVIWLPESIRLLALRETEDAKVARVLARISPALRFDSGTRFVAAEEHPPGFPVRHLFTEGRSAGTLLLWVMFFMNLLDLYFLANWLPTVIHNTGISVRLAVLATALLQVGGVVGTLILARLIDRFRPYPVLAATYFCAALFLAGIGYAGSAIALIMALVFAAGFCVVGAQIGANALAALYYPTFIRSSGVGWALGIGRIGSIIGPVVGGILLAQQWNITTIFLVGAIPALIAAAAVFSMGHLTTGLPGKLAVAPRLHPGH
jgi:MFS transporter, AAHS family, 4-hydroxybenzoate transporter